jgi:transcriptional regulator with GAF, ATPase, and Fis domain
MAASDSSDAPTANTVGKLEDVLADLARLGDGAEGGAWVGTDRASGRRVVAKRVAAEQRAEMRHAFGVLRQVASPHLPTPRALVADAGGDLWLLHDFAEGAAVGPGPVPAAVALGEAAAVAHALWTIHEAGTHHGDVSAGNVVVTPTGGVVLVDLGHLGRVGAGTPGFLAAEVLAGGGGPAADRFALGCLLCLRLSGRVPWQRPEQVLAVRTRADVRARLAALLPAVDPPVLRLLTALLDPDPHARWPETASLVAHLRGLRDAAAGIDAPARRWWPAGRLAYRGTDLSETVARLAQERRPRLVAIAGPPGSGRGRVGEELVMSLQLRDVDARQCDVEGLAARVGRPGASWYEAWTAPTSGPTVVALSEAPQWQGAAGGEAATARAGRLAAGAALAGRTLIVPVSADVGAALHGRPGVVVVVARPWTRDEVEQALGGVVDGPAGAWAEALHEVTGGWSGRLTTAIAACARVDCARPDPAQIERALESAPAFAALDAATARAVVVARWLGRPESLRAVPGHLHDGERPYGSAVVAARARLGDTLRSIAAAVAADVDGPISLDLALDADRPDAVAAALQRDGTSTPAQRERLVAWLLAGGAASLPAAAVRVVARAQLAEGDAEGVLRLAEAAAPEAPEDGGLAFERARALHRVGRADEALTVLTTLAEGPPGDSLTWSARGLRWRVFVDQGRAADAVIEATRVLAVVPSGRKVAAGLATAFLWAAMAQLVGGDNVAARRWLQQAGALARDADADDTLARVEQLRGNLALAGDDLGGARRCFAAAAGAFERAGEPVGATAVRGSLAALAIPTWATAAGVEHGRAALRSLLAAGQRSATLEAALNLVQLLARIDARDEVAQLRRAVDDLWAHDADVVVVARRARLGAEQDALAARTGAGPAAAAELSLSRAADALRRAGLSREAVEARLRAASWARRDGRLADAATHLREAGSIDADDADSAAGRLLEGVAQGLARSGDATAVAAAASSLSSLPPVARLLARGRTDLAWARDRLLLSALRRTEPAGSAARQAAARRLAKTLEEIMSKTAPVDRVAVRAALDSEAGDAGAMVELLEELGEDAAVSGSAPARPRARGRAVATTRRDELLRIYRRLAREDHLERLLEQVVDAVMELTDAERGAVVVLATDGTERVEVTRELGQGTAAVRYSRSVIERVLVSGEPVLSVDAAADDRFDESRSISHLNLRSVLAVPLRFRGELVGAAYVDHRLRRGNFDEHDLAHMEEFAELAALAVAHARAVRALEARTKALVDEQRDLAQRLEAREAEAATLRVQVLSATRVQAVAPAGMIGTSASMQRVFRLIDRLADTDVPVVIYGESGTGKELVARAIHEGGGRRTGPFVAENCAAIPETLLESVLFGHARGAFTGAQVAKPGLFEAAHGGTIFLDEVSEMSAGMQSKLLRVLQEGEVRRVGENAPRPVDVRVVAASNRDLDALVEAGEFRRDLFYRINVIKLELPPLRERADDLPALIEHFVAKYGAGPGALLVTPAAMRRLSGYAWPGNVRELENEVQRWAALCEGEVEVEDLSPALSSAASITQDPDDLRIRPRVERLERELIDQALARTEGNQTRAAELLGLSRFGLQKKLRRMDIDAR